MTVEHELASRPFGRSLTRTLSTAARQQLLQRLGDHRGDGAPRLRGVRPHPSHQLYWQLDGEDRGCLRHLHRPSGDSALDIPARLALREPESAGQLTGRISHPSAGSHQFSCSVDPRGVLLGTSPTTTNHAIKILPNMSHTPRDTRQTLQPAVTQRHLEAEVAHCVGGVATPPCGVPVSVLSAIAVLVEDARLEERLHQSQDAFVPDASAHPVHQGRVRDLVERSPALLPVSRTCRRR